MESFFKYGSPIIELAVEGEKIEMLLDTGFNGHIMLPQKTIDKLNLEQIGLSDFTTASGEEKQTNVYKAKLEFFNEEIDVPIISTDSSFSLAGLELFHYCKIIIERHKNVLEITET